MEAGREQKKKRERDLQSSGKMEEMEKQNNLKKSKELK